MYVLDVGFGMSGVALRERERAKRGPHYKSPFDPREFILQGSMSMRKKEKAGTDSGADLDQFRPVWLRSNAFISLFPCNEDAYCTVQTETVWFWELQLSFNRKKRPHVHMFIDRFVQL